MPQDVNQFFQKAADILELSDCIRKILLTPRRIVKVEIITEEERVRKQISKTAQFRPTSLLPSPFTLAC